MRRQRKFIRKPLVKMREFYKFYRSLEAYRASFKNKSDVMVVDQNSEFFKYFKAPVQRARRQVKSN